MAKVMAQSNINNNNDDDGNNEPTSSSTTTTSVALKSTIEQRHLKGFKLHININLFKYKIRFWFRSEISTRFSRNNNNNNIDLLFKINLQLR